jgi:hypothetical protein
MNVKEEWKTIKEYENYKISSLGRLKNIKLNKINVGCNHMGYVRIKLAKNNVTKSFLLHRIVAENFIPNPENKKEVNHLGDKTDNRVCMLEWVTHKENTVHSAKYKTNVEKIPINLRCSKTNIILESFERTLEAINFLKNIGITQYIFYKYLDSDKVFKGYLIERKNKKKVIKNFINEKWVYLKDSIYNEINIFPKYMVSNYGRIKGHYNNILVNNCCNDYESIKLINENITKSMKIHRIVIMGFNILNHGNKKEVDHIDSNKNNNKLENLRWASKNDQINNINSKNKLNKQCVKRQIRIEVKKLNNEKIYNSLSAISFILKIAPVTIKKYANLNKKFKNYEFKIIN